jgi:predicted dehydrogenase
MKKVVLSGFKGDCCGRNYNKALIKMALEKKIELTCVDLGKPKNVLGVPSLKDMMQMIKSKKVRYLDLENPRDVKKYIDIKDIDVALIATPDFLHAKIAQEFLGKAKRIFIDKPLDSILRNVRMIESFSGVDNLVFCYDHYLSKFYPFELQTDQWLKQGIIGNVKKIEFRLLEPTVIPRHRISALDAGMVYDLFSHGLAVITAIPNKWAYPDLQNLQKLKILEVKVGKYEGCRIHGCSYSKIIFEVPLGKTFIPCKARVGKGVGKKFEKILEITGSKGKILVDIENYQYEITNAAGGKIKEGKLVYDYAEHFLAAAINVKNPVYKIPGAMPLNAGKEILYILDEADWRKEPKGRIPRYPVGSSIAEIEKIIESRMPTS